MAPELDDNSGLLGSGQVSDTEGCPDYDPPEDPEPDDQ